MGTNYYAYKNTCPTCGRSDEQVHIGKSSAGWSFSFHTDLGLPRSWAEWRDRLRDARIEDEYGREVPLAEFEALVESKRGHRNHATLYPERGNYVDPEGHSFSEGEFS